MCVCVYVSSIGEAVSQLPYTPCWFALLDNECSEIDTCIYSVSLATDPLHCVCARANGAVAIDVLFCRLVIVSIVLRRC